MNVSAANALLKILEEPPKKTVIILISHQPGKLLPTIRSRCRTLACEKLDPSDLMQALSHAGFEEMERVSSISELADGSVGEAMSLAQGGGQELYQRIIDVFGGLPSLDRTESLAIADGCAGKGKEATYALTRHLLAVALNRMAKAGARGEPLSEAAQGEAEIFARLAPSPHMARIWADLSQELSARIAHGVAVNLDPSGLILDTFLKVEATAETYAPVFFAAGSHPMHVFEEPMVSVEDLLEVAKHPKMVGIGETGLDYHYTSETKEVQQESLRIHIEAARRSKLPLIIHARAADEDMARILSEEHANGAYNCVMHCFSSHTAQVGADLFGMTLRDFAAQTEANFERLFWKAKQTGAPS